MLVAIRDKRRDLLINHIFYVDAAVVVVVLLFLLFLFSNLMNYHAGGDEYLLEK
jgi:hypothetical protein